MINWIKTKWQEHKQRVAKIRFDAAVEDPTLFSDPIREHLKSCFPTQWTHLSNLSQLELFKIAISLELLGFQCSDAEDFAFCVKVLIKQKICALHPTNVYLIKQA